MFIFISGVMAPLTESVKRDYGRLRKLRDGRKLCLEIRNDRCISLLDPPESISRGFTLLTNSFRILQLLNLFLL
jgi:hypothetical protein